MRRDRIRTAINVLGDSFGAGIIEQLSRDDLAAMDDAGIGAGARGGADGDSDEMTSSSSGSGLSKFEVEVGKPNRAYEAGLETTSM